MYLAFVRKCFLLYISADFWVVETNYQYAIIFGCHQLDTDGICHRDHVLVYILARSPSIPHSIKHHIQKVIQRDLCVDPRLLQETKHNELCPLDDDVTAMLKGKSSKRVSFHKTLNLLSCRGAFAIVLQRPNLIS